MKIFYYENLELYGTLTHQRMTQEAEKAITLVITNHKTNISVLMSHNLCPYLQAC